MQSSLIKVFGERNTATRAISAMIDTTDGVRLAGLPQEARQDIQAHTELIEAMESVLEGPWRKVYREAILDAQEDLVGPLGAWKHTAPHYDPAFREGGVKTIFMVRDPYSWALSLHEHPYHDMGVGRKRPFEEFLVFPWLTLARDRVSKVLLSPVELWSLKLSAYNAFTRAAQAAGVACCFVRFEDFVADPVNVLQQALNKLAIKHSKIEVMSAPTKPGGLEAAERQAYYREERWTEKLSSLAVGLINDVIDWDIAAQHGYRWRDPDDFPEHARSAGSDRERRTAATA